MGHVSTRPEPAAVLDWIAKLKVTQGPAAGRPLNLLDWERRFVLRALAPGVRQAALSVARGNGKTTLVAAIAAAAIAGPLRQPRAEVSLVAASYQQARVAFDHTLAFLSEALFPRAHWTVANSHQSGYVIHKPTGARLRLLSSDPKRAHGIAPSLIIADEPAQWTTGTGERMYSALVTSLGKIEGARLIALGTRPASDGHWFQRLLDGDGDGAVVADSYHADPECDVHDPDAWAAANPSLPAMPELESAIRAESEAARANPGMLAAFRALRLNLGTPDSDNRELLVDVDTWRACCSTSAAASGGYVLGLDVGGSLALSAAVAVWPATGRLEAMAQCGQIPALERRGAMDGVGSLYEQAHAAGELCLNNGRVADVGALLARARDAWGAPGVIVCDRWRLAELRDTLEALGGPWASAAVLTRGQGFKDGNDDVRRFRDSVATGRVHPARQFFLLEAGIADAVVASDPAGNVKLAKKGEGGRRNRARDDVAAAAILAVAHADRVTRRPAGRVGAAIA